MRIEEKTLTGTGHYATDKTDKHRPPHKRTARWAFFDSVAELMEHTPAHPFAAQLADLSERYESGSTWLGCDRADLDRYLSEGWPEGAALLSDADGIDIEPLPTMRRRARYGDQGEQVDALRIVTGQLDRAWIRHERSARPGIARVTLTVNLASASKESARDLKWQGAAVVRFADAMEAAGYRVRILAYALSMANSKGHNPTDTAVVVTVKEFDQPLNLATLAAVVALAGFKRRHIHKMYYATSKGAQNETLGKPTHDLSPASFAGLFPEQPGEALIHTPKIRSEAEACAWIRAAATMATNAAA